MLGQVYDVQPMAPDSEHTSYLDAGVLRIGVEYRKLDPAALEAYYSGDDLAEVIEHSPDGGFVDQGVSIHVESVADDHEYLRFDVFDDDPHYHYVDKAAGTNQVIGFDTAAHGDMLQWVIAQMRDRLGPMLEAAGAGHVAALLDRDSTDKIASDLAAYLDELGLNSAGSKT